MTPIPGRPDSLSPEVYLADAEALLSILRGSVAARSRYASGAVRVAREALWFLWELPRLPRPLVASKYPIVYPWSPEARARFSENQRRPRGGWGLVLEHLTPRVLVLDRLLGHVVAGADAEEVVEFLTGHLAGTVMTRDEDKQLTAAGFGQSMPDSASADDVWARYREAGLDPSSYQPLRGRVETSH